MSTYKVTEIEFLTQMPKNNFKGDQALNAYLQGAWIGQVLECDANPERHLDELLNYIEDTCGMLVGHVIVECVGRRNPKTPKSFTETMPSLSGKYPAGWIWNRKATLVN